MASVIQPLGPQEPRTHSIRKLYEHKKGAIHFCGRAFSLPISHVEICSEDPTAAHNFGAIVEHRRLPRRYRALRLIKCGGHFASA